MLMYPWQVLRGVELRADTFRLWAREHRTRWSFRLHHPHFEAATESPDLGQALCDLARVCAVMAEPFGVPAGRVSSDVPGVIPGGPRPLPAADEAARAAVAEAAARAEAAEEGEPEAAAKPEAGTEPDVSIKARTEAGDGQGESEPSPEPVEAGNDSKPTALPIGEGEELIELGEEERAAIPTRSDDQG
jgi:hypothetical protein